jgi:hypothetical protein
MAHLVWAIQLGCAMPEKLARYHLGGPHTRAMTMEFVDRLDLISVFR